MSLDDKDLATTQLSKNIVFIGSTGSGKSSTCNTIYNSEEKEEKDKEEIQPFLVGNTEVSCTRAVSERFCVSRNAYLIDTPDFNDNRFDDSETEKSLSYLNSLFVNARHGNSHQIDAFVLVVRLTPRAQTLKDDLQRLKNLFGPMAFKSLVLLLIYSKSDPDNGDRFLENLRNMDEVVRFLREGKGEEPNENWYCVWDNKIPREGQVDELFKKIEILKPYTHQDLIDAEKVRSRLGEGEIDENNLDRISTIEELETKMKGSDLLDESFSKILEVIEAKHQTYTKKLNEYVKRNDEELDKFMNRLDDLAEQEKEKKANKQTGGLFIACACRKRKLKKEEKKDLAKETLGKSSKAAVKTGAKKLAKSTPNQLVSQMKQDA